MNTEISGESRIRVLVVDDSVVIRNLVVRTLSSDPALSVVGVAAQGRIALAKIPLLKPDIVTLDIEMPEMNGLQTLHVIRQLYPGLRVIMFSSLTERGASVTLDALSMGADDYVTKPSSNGGLEAAMATLREELIPKIKGLFQSKLASRIGVPSTAPKRVRTAPETGGRQLDFSATVPPGALAIGVSTGGPTALSAMIPVFPPDFPLPILIVQHMPAMFTRLLAERLCKIGSLNVVEADQGAAVEPGKVIIAPGGSHMYVRRESGSVRIALDTVAPRNSCRPSVDSLFESVADVYGASAIGVVLTGMGYDGLRGADKMKSTGARIIAQDEASSVVWGMAGSVVGAGIADAVLPLNEVVPAILKIVDRCRPLQLRT